MYAPPTVLGAMTPFPVPADPDTPLIAAQAIMQGHEIGHLPVIRDHEILGIVSAADLRLAMHLLDQDQLPIKALCVTPPLTISIEEPLKKVLFRMTDAGVDAAVVLRQGRLAGILTLSDISTVLLRLLPAPFVDQGGGIA